MPYIGNTPTTQNFIAGTDQFTGNGSSTNFTLSRFVNSVNDIQVTVANVVQNPTSYSVSGNTLTISPAVGNGVAVYVRYLSTTLQSVGVGDGTITTAKIANGAVTTAKISATGTPSASTFLSGAGTWGTPGGGFSNIQVFTASGSWTVPAGVTKAKVTVVGGGGGGGGGFYDGCNVNGGGGGGGGGTAIEVVSGLTPGGTVTVTVGVGGAALINVGFNPVNGNAGGTSSFGAFCSATGGGGGGGTGGSGARGAGSGGDLNISGGAGGGSVLFGGGPLSGEGGGTFFAQPALGVGFSGNGNPGLAYGGGGSGCGGSNTGNNRNSGAGAAGVVIVEW